MADAQGVGGALVEGDLRNYSGDPVLLFRNRQISDNRPMNDANRPIFIRAHKERS